MNYSEDGSADGRLNPAPTLMRERISADRYDTAVSLCGLPDARDHLL